MEKVERYRKIIREVLTPLLSRNYSNMNAHNELVWDEVNNRYLVMTVGWQREVRRIHGCLAHLDIINDKVWIQRDGTEDGLGNALAEAGIPKADIVPAFHPENVRPFTGYAVV